MVFNMRNWIWIVLGVLVVLGGILLFQGDQQIAQPDTERGIGGGPGVLPESNKMEIDLNPVSEDQFNQSGKASFEQRDSKVVVTLSLDQVDNLNNQPAHIHTGSCPGVGEILYPLNNVVNGKSVTEIDTTLDQLRSTQNPMALNIHKSEQELSVYTSCGELPR